MVRLPEDDDVQVWLTTGDRSRLLSPEASVAFADDAGFGATTVEVNAGVRYQTMDGFGASVTGSSAYLIDRKLSAEQKESLLNDLFTEDGIRLTYARHSIGASDFSVDERGEPYSYTYDDVEAGGTDFGLTRFSVEKDAQVIGLLQDILAKNEGVRVLGTPWTAPPWMKTGDRIYNGWYLNYADPRVYDAYANYFVKYIQAYEKAGIPIDAITVQNEPEFTSPSYPSMSMGAPEQATFIREHLGPAFARNGIAAKIIAFDHNWDLGEAYADTVLGDEGASAYIDGTAYHCYGGAPDAMSAVHDAFPEKHIYFTECSGGGWSTDFGDNLSWYMSTLVIGAPRHWAKTVLFWNLALDPQGGPTNGGCADCRGVVTVDPASGTVTRNAEYYAIGHASKFVDPGAVRIDSTSFDGRLETAAFQNPDGSVALLAANPRADAAAFRVRWNTKSFYYSLPPRSAVTFVWK